MNIMRKITLKQLSLEIGVSSEEFVFEENLPEFEDNQE